MPAAITAPNPTYAALLVVTIHEPWHQRPGQVKNTNEQKSEASFAYS
jgi:hypothetical protein